MNIEEHGLSQVVSGAGLSVCIVAYKDLRLNTRVARQAAALAAAGHSVTVVGFDGPDLTAQTEVRKPTVFTTGVPSYPGSLMKGLSVAGRVLALPGGSGLRLGAAAAVAAARSRHGVFARQVLKMLSARSFDVVQAHDEKALIAAAAVTRRCGGRLVFDAVEVPFDEEKLPAKPVSRAVRLAEIRQEIAIARAADSWVTISDALADHAKERFGVIRPLVVRNCQYDDQPYSDGRLRSDLGLTEKALVLFHLNTLRFGEGVEVVIEALSHLPADVHFVALGPEGEPGFVARMKDEAAAKGVSDRFHVPSLKPVHTISAYAAGADIGVIAREAISRNNRLSLPNRIFQLIAARLPVIVTPLPEIARLVQEWELGLLFDERNPVELAATVQKMAKPLVRAKFKQAVDNAARSLIWERESCAYVQLIETIASSPRDPRKTRNSNEGNPAPRGLSTRASRGHRDAANPVGARLVLYTARGSSGADTPMPSDA